MPSGDVGFVFLLVIHIVSVVSWMGAAVLFVIVIGPALQKLNAQSRADFLLEVLPKFGRFIQFSSTVTLIAGITLLGYVGSVDTNLLPSGLGLLLLLSGGVLGLVAFIVAMIVVVPSSNRLASALAKLRETQGQTKDTGLSEELARFQDAIRGGSRAVIALLAIVLILMVSGTYL